MAHLVVGHTHDAPDRMFAVISKHLASKPKDAFTLKLQS